MLELNKTSALLISIEIHILSAALCSGGGQRTNIKDGCLGGVTRNSLGCDKVYTQLKLFFFSRKNQGHVSDDSVGYSDYGDTATLSFVLNHLQMVK